MEIKGKTQKECIKIFREHAKNKPGRQILLAYAFLKERPYKWLEKRINEDKFPEVGRNSFLLALSYSIATCIDLSIGKDRMPLSDYKILRDNINSWIQEKYK